MTSTLNSVICSRLWVSGKREREAALLDGTGHLDHARESVVGERDARHGLCIRLIDEGRREIGMNPWLPEEDAKPRDGRAQTDAPRAQLVSSRLDGEGGHCEVRVIMSARKASMSVRAVSTAVQQVETPTLTQ